MNRVVFDASAILAIIHQEPGFETLTPELLANAMLSTVNLVEIQSKLIGQGWTSDEAWEDASGTVEEIVPFSSDQARLAGSLITETRAFGLSLGDRACLALGLESKAPVYTADRSWKNLKIGVRIHLIR